MITLDEREQHEIQHGKYLAASGNPELLWNWDTPAGKLRATRRGKLIREAAKLKAGDRVLEIGCGTGLFTEMLAESQANILAVDISPDLIELAMRRSLTSSQVEFRVMAFEESPLNNPFDAIVGSSVLHHLDINLALPHIYKLLKPKGVLVFAEPNMLNPQIWAERNIPAIRKRNHVSEDETAFIRWELAKKLKQTGFKNTVIQNIDWLHPATPSPLIPFIRQLGLYLECIPLVKEFSGSLLIYAEREE
jgi:2-polyprenyl-3-methyl-5-hydroxy-6-metoxy-1,4-benzoquinol methylase